MHFCLVTSRHAFFQLWERDASNYPDLWWFFLSTQQFVVRLALFISDWQVNNKWLTTVDCVAEVLEQLKTENIELKREHKKFCDIIERAGWYLFVVYYYACRNQGFQIFWKWCCQTLAKSSPILLCIPMEAIDSKTTKVAQKIARKVPEPNSSFSLVQFMF